MNGWAGLCAAILPTPFLLILVEIAFTDDFFYYYYLLDVFTCTVQYSNWS
eukprot:m.8673 g.8673  ORF g.8673 m.8673 type:complete len:50 (+) comp20758_c0_seq1:4571-4720(+)